MDTIFALATARGRAGVAVMRISGPLAHLAASKLCDLPPARQAGLRALAHDGQIIDQALVLVFDAGASFTGEAVVEFHLHGSIAVIAEMTRILSQTTGLRMAEAGEFTRRALDNGKMDLPQVEALADLIDAESEAQRKLALRVLSGAISQKIQPWRSALIRAAALIEATIDFADEDVPVDVIPEVRDLLQTVRDDIAREAAGSLASEQIRDGFEVAILGAPNIGKSTLLNALAQREAAITSEIAGTTRDVIEVRMDIGGYSVTLLDTAGLRESDDVVESIGITRAMQRAEQADLRVFLMQDEAEVFPMPFRADDIRLLGKGDLSAAETPSISGKTGQGVDVLVRMIAQRLDNRLSSPSVFSRARHRIALDQAETALQQALETLPNSGTQPELVAAELRLALYALERIMGRVDVEDLLTEIFSSFCIGK
jgi:tRNA modification GTPase